MDGMTGIELMQMITQVHDYFKRGLFTADELEHSKSEIIAEWTLNNPMICYTELCKAYA